MKKISIALLVLLAFTGIVGLSAYWLAKQYEPEVREAVVYEVNRLLDVEVSVEDINLSLLQRFPYASLRLSNVVVPEAYHPEKPDTLLYVKDLYLQISLWDFLRKRYRISEAELNTGFLRMKVFADGKDNYHFWKATESANPTVLSLNDIQFREFEYTLRIKKEVALDVSVRLATAKGLFGSEVYDITTDCTLNMNLLALEGDTLYRNLPVAGNVILNINQLTNTHNVSSKALKVGNEKLTLEGQYQPDRNNAWRVALQASSAKIENIIELLPQNMRGGLRAYKAKGRSDLVFEASDADNAALSVDLLFDQTKGSFQHDVAMGKANIDKGAGSLQVRGSTVSLYIDHLEGGIGPGKLKIQGSIRDFSAPAFDLNVDGNVDLREVRNFFNLDYLDEMKGKVTLAGTFRGKLPKNSANEGLTLLKGIDFDGNINLKNGALRPRASTTFFEDINGNVTLSDNAFRVKEATASVNGNAFMFSGKISNALPYLIRTDQKLYIAADFSAKSIDLNRIFDASTTRRDTSYQFSLPESVSFDFRLDVGQITFRRFEAKKISGRAVYSNDLLTLSPISFEVASGRAAGSASVQRRSATKYEVNAGAELRQINITEFFYAFENFGQTMVTHRHLSGKADARLTLQSILRNDLSLDLNSMTAQIELMVVKGKLQKVEALADVAEYLRGNMVWRSLVKVDAFEKKLASIDFDTLRNTIDIRNRTVFIPAMRVGSSALTLNLSGNHTFDNHIDYRMSFRLSELLRTGKPKQEEFGYIEDDQTGLRLFLRMAGTVDDPIFSMDKDGARQKRKADFEQEKSTFKGILKDEFGLFKGDTTLTAPPVKKGKSTPIFTLESDDLERRADSLKTQEKKPVKKRGPLSPRDKKQTDDYEYGDDL